MLGNELMITPIYKQNANGRYVYLPEEMMLVRMKKYDDFETEILPKGHHYIPCKLSELIFFIRKDKAIAMCTPAECTEKIDISTAKLLGYQGCTYTLYKDDGISPDPKDSLEISVLK